MDMLNFVLAYMVVIDKITADKGLKLRRYELDNDNLGYHRDLVSVLRLSVLFIPSQLQTLVSSNLVNHYHVCKHKIQHVISEFQHVTTSGE